MPLARQDLLAFKTLQACTLEHAIQPHLRLFLILAITTGARKSALLELKWKQVDMQNRIISLAAKDMRRKKPREAEPGI